MKNLAPYWVMILLLITFVSLASAQTYHNPDLPNHLVFQWKIESETVPASWNNDDFSIVRSKKGNLTIFYGVYRTLEEALSHVPDLPNSVERSKVSLVPFFNRKSISQVMAFALLANQNELDKIGLKRDKEAVSFTVYFKTYDQPQSRSSIGGVDEDLSFEILPDYSFAYAAGQFETVDEAEVYATYLQSIGYIEAKVNKYVNGRRMAAIEEKLLGQYLAYVF